MIFTANQLLCMQSFELALVIMAIFQFVLSDSAMLKKIVLVLVILAPSALYSLYCES